MYDARRLYPNHFPTGRHLCIDMIELCDIITDVIHNSGAMENEGRFSDDDVRAAIRNVQTADNFRTLDDVYAGLAAIFTEDDQLNLEDPWQRAAYMMSWLFAFPVTEFIDQPIRRSEEVTGEVLGRVGDERARESRARIRSRVCSTLHKPR